MEEHEWELMKENVQPLRHGRTMSSLSKGLHADPKDEGAIRENKRAFEMELRTYDGDDPLDVWYRYIKWTEQHFPKGGRDGQLPILIKECLQKLEAESQYVNDPRFIKLWIEFSNFTDSTTDTFAYMFDNGIGLQVAQLYVEWAAVLEIAGNMKRADAIYTEGLNRKAEPRDLLLQKQEQFQHRLAKNITLQMADRNKPESMERDEEEKREVLTRLKPTGGGRTVGTTRTGAVSAGPAGRLKLQKDTGSSKQIPSQGFAVFNDENAIHQPVQTNEWVSMPHRLGESKENDSKPGVWTGAKLRQGPVANESASSAKEKFQIHEDHAGLEAVTPLKTTVMTHKPLSAMKAPQKSDVLGSFRHGQGVPNLNDGIPMYPKEKIYNGVEEFSFEELRFIQFRKKVEIAKKEEERRGREEEMKVKLEAQEERLKALESLLQSRLTNLDIQQRDPAEGEREVQAMESESDAVFVQTSSSSSSSSSERKTVSAKRDLFANKMEEAAPTTAAAPVNESTDFITPTNFSFSCKPPSSTKSVSSNGSHRTPIFNSVSTYSSIGSSGGGGSLKGLPRQNSAGRLQSRLDTSSSLNQSSTRSTPQLTDEMSTSVCGGLNRNKVAITAPSPTVCTREAFQLVQGMFCDELGSESVMEEPAETAEIGQAMSSVPFQICEDKTEHNLPNEQNREEPMSPAIHRDSNRTQEKCAIYQDENNIQNNNQPFQCYQDENNIQNNNQPFQCYQDENVPLVTSSRPASSKKEGRKFGARLSFPVTEDVDMTDMEKGQLQDFTMAQAQEDVTLASLSTFSIKACAASTPYHGMHENKDRSVTADSVEPEVSLPSCSGTNGELMDPNYPQSYLSPILEGSGEGSSNSDIHTKSQSQVHSSLESKSVHHSVAASSVKSVIHEEPDERLLEESVCDNHLLDATCTHIIDTSACVPPEETDALLAASISVHATRDPYEKEAISLYLSNLQPPLSSYKNYVTMREDVQSVSENSMIDVGNDVMIVVNKCLGEGGYAQVYKMCRQSFDDLEDFDQNLEAMKVQQPPCYWEFYISCEIQRRLTALNPSVDVRPSIMPIKCGYFNTTMSILAMKLLEHGSLLNLVNLYKADPKLLGEVEPFVCLATIELLHLFEQLNKSHIIHGDVKPDNFLLRDLPVVCESGNPSEVLGSDLRVFCLIDFGQTIDMHMFPSDTTFRNKSNTKGFECIEMRTDRPWTYQTDLFGLAGTVHVLLFGSYMNVFVEKGTWKITGNFVRKWNVPLWKKLFHQLLNIPSCDNLPDLSSLRAEFEEYFCSSLAPSYNRWARTMKVLLNKDSGLNSTKI